MVLLFSIFTLLVHILILFNASFLNLNRLLYLWTLTEELSWQTRDREIKKVHPQINGLITSVLKKPDPQCFLLPTPFIINVKAQCDVQMSQQKHSNSAYALACLGIRGLDL